MVVHDVGGVHDLCYQGAKQNEEASMLLKEHSEFAGLGGRHRRCMHSVQVRISATRSRRQHQIGARTERRRCPAQTKVVGDDVYDRVGVPDRRLRTTTYGCMAVGGRRDAARFFFTLRHSGVPHRTSRLRKGCVSLRVVSHQVPQTDHHHRAQFL